VLPSLTAATDLALGTNFTVTDPASGVTITAVVINPAAPVDIANPPGTGLTVGDWFTVTDSAGEVLTAVRLA
jgi:hypothetical protein